MHLNRNIAHDEAHREDHMQHHYQNFKKGIDVQRSTSCIVQEPADIINYRGNDEGHIMLD